MTLFEFVGHLWVTAAIIFLLGVWRYCKVTKNNEEIRE